MGSFDKIPAADPSLKFKRGDMETMPRIAQVINQGQYILSEHVSDFEDAFAQYYKAKYCVAVNSGTDALSLVLRAAGVEPGAEVITTSMTAPATIVAILNAGAVPVVVDVTTPTYCIDVNRIESAISPNTQAVVPVHLHGYLADIEQISQLCNHFGLKLIEDCAQAHGAHLDSEHPKIFGIAASFSFYPTKNLSCPGDGGAVLTDDDEIALNVRRLRNYGIDEKGDIIEAGINSRMDAVMAIILSDQLKRLDAANQARRMYAQLFHSELSDFKEFLPPWIRGAVFHQFALRHPKRDKLKYLLQREGVDTAIHYSRAIPHYDAFFNFCKDCSLSIEASKKFLSLPIQPEILDLNWERLIEKLRLCLKRV